MKQKYKLQNKVTGVQAGSLMHFDTYMTAIDYLKMLVAMDVDTRYNPRTQRVRGAQVTSMMETLDTDPSQFYSGNKGVRIACADMLTGPFGDSVTGPLHIYDGAHTTLAIVAFVLKHLCIRVKTDLAEALVALKKADDEGFFLEDNLPDNFVQECRVPVRFTCASSKEALADGSCESALKTSAKATNTSVAVSKPGLFFNSTAGICVLRRVRATTSKEIVHQDARLDEKNSLSSDIIVRIVALLLSMLPTANTGVVYGKKRVGYVSGVAASHGVASMTAYIQNVLDCPGIISSETLEIDDRNISSLLDMMPDLMLGSDMLYNVFERLFNNLHGKKYAADLGGGYGTQTSRQFSKVTRALSLPPRMRIQTACYKFGLARQTDKAELVTYTMIAPLLCAMRQLIAYDATKGFYWVITPEKVLTDHVDLLAALLNPYSKKISEFLPKSSLLRHIHEIKDHHEPAERAFCRIKELVQYGKI